MNGHPAGARLFVRELSADCDTPISVFARLRGGGDCFLFESAEGGEHWGRYSIIGFAPAAVVVDQGGRLHIRRRNGSREERAGGITEWLRREVIAAPEIAHALPFTGGAVGFLAYDIVHRFEAVPSRHSLRDQPMAAFLLIDRFIVFDNLRGSMFLCVRGADDGDAELDAMEELLAKPLPPPLRLDVTAAAAAPQAHMPQAEFMAMVERAKAYIRDGDIFQVVLSQRFSAPLACDPLAIYRAVRHVNPSPYLFYLHVGNTVLIGSSPEILVRKTGARAVVRPIAGTRPRGATPEEDKRLEAELLADDKERAEHVMLVDLGRNDLGRVCRFGTVRLTESMCIERYSHVMHIVSQVEGELRPGVDAVDLLAATFPAGTVSGAPKVRAMQIIDELEPHPRGAYAGAVGYLAFGGGRMDTAITIRTAVVQEGKVHVQAGAGIVADSVPEREHAECVNKASAMFRAVAIASAQEQA